MNEKLLRYKILITLDSIYIGIISSKANSLQNLQDP